jgi:DNA helicase-2/ATP-dependent DNA helicase PcrA
MTQPRPATFVLRREQDEIARYDGGLLRVSAVPGSGKTQTLAALTTRLLKSGRIPPDSEILIVTFTNSAVDNIRARIRAMLVAEGAIADVGYKVLTLHGLAYLIIRERPDLAGISADFAMDDELSGRQTIPEAARAYQRENRDYWLSFIPADLGAARRDKAEEQWSDKTEAIAREVIRMAKNLRWTSADLLARLAEAGDAPGARSAVSPFLRMGARLYERYEDILRTGGRLDFDDLIWRAVAALDNDDGFRRRLGQRFCYILEDEAQDSTPLQEDILGRLSREHGNWVRVGDPNQAIMTTFTASSVRFFRDDFPRRPGVRGLPLSVSGRSAPEIYELANRLAAWSEAGHPEREARDLALSAATLIRPTDPGDPQPNPANTPGGIQARPHADDDAQADMVARGALRFVIEHPGATCAILTPTNSFGEKIVARLEVNQGRRERPLYEDHLRNSVAVRNVAEALASGVALCASPQQGKALMDLRRALRALEDGAARQPRQDRVDALLRSAWAERLLFPSPLAEPALPERVEVSAAESTEMQALAARAAKWVRASALPIDQLMLTIAHDAFDEDADLAIAHSLAISMRRVATLHPRWDLAELAAELESIAANRQQFLSKSLLETGFVARPGIVAVTTLHKAKGLEWDRVYLTCMDGLEFPHDADAPFRGEAWYLGGRDPALEARAQLEEIASAQRAGRPANMDERALSRLARLEYIAERMRLLYVGITRARRELRISWSERRSSGANSLALALSAVGVESHDTSRI